MINPFTLNPALGGTEDFIDIKMGYRTQWVGFEGAPKTYYVTGHGTIGKEFNASAYHHKGEHKSWHGIGGYVYRDKAGPFSKDGLSVQYAYNFPLNEKIRLSAGSFVGLKNFSYDVSGLRREEFDDEAIPFSKISKTIPDVSIGLWMYSSSWYLGISGFQLLQNKVGGKDLQLSEDGRLLSHYFVNGGARLPVNENFVFVPSFGLKAILPVNVSLDTSVKLDYKDSVWGGVSFRSGDSFSFLLGGLIKSVEVTYSYDVTISSVSKVSSGSHEVVLGLRIKHPKHILCASRFW